MAVDINALMEQLGLSSDVLESLQDQQEVPTNPTVDDLAKIMAEQFRRVINVIRDAKKFLQLMTADYEEDGIHLIRKAKIKRLVEQLGEFQEELNKAKQAFRDHEHTLRMELAEKLCELYNPADYPSCIADAYSLTFDFPNLTPNPELAKIGKELFDAQLAQYETRLKQSVQDTVSGFSTGLSAQQVLSGVNPEALRKRMH